MRCRCVCPSLVSPIGLVALTLAGVLVVTSASAQKTPSSEAKKTAATEEDEGASDAPTTTAPVERLKVMVPDVKAVSDVVTETDVMTTSALLSYQLAQVPQFDVVSARDIREMLALETNKQLAGCTGEASCLSEIAGALDADLVVTGLMSHLGGRRVLQVSIIDTQEAAVKGRKQITVNKTSELTEVLRKELSELCEPWGGIPSLKEEEEVAPNTSFGRQVASVANRPDASMLLVQILVGSMGVIAPFLFITPIAQALSFLWLGEEVAGRDYPNWWWPIWAGYVAYGVSILAGISVAVGVAQVAPQFAAASGVATFFAGAFVFEPMIAWGAGIVGAQDSAVAAFEATTPGEADTDVIQPPPENESVGLQESPLDVFASGALARQRRAIRLQPLTLHGLHAVAAR